MKAKIIIAIVAILAILGGTFAGLWFFTDVFNFLKPENEVFSNQVEKALNIEEAKFVDYSDFLKEYKEMLMPLIDTFEKKYGPLKAGSNNTSKWKWINSPWPWEPQEDD